MDESILTTIKKMLNITAECTSFDTNIIVLINAQFATLNQLGVGPEEGFSISDSSAVWTDFISDLRKYESVKTYIYCRVAPLFDGSTMSSSLADAFKRTADELEWRLKTQAEDDSALK